MFGTLRAITSLPIPSGKPRSNDEDLPRPTQVTAMKSFPKPPTVARCGSKSRRDLRMGTFHNVSRSEGETILNRRTFRPSDRDGHRWRTRRDKLLFAAMSKKTQQDQPSDDWAGLAQNLFGINLDKGTGDDDLLDDDMFKVELPKPPEPPVSIPQSDVEFAPVAETEPVSPAPAAPPIVAAKPTTKTPPQRVVRAVLREDEPFGFGVVEEAPVLVSEQPTLSAESSQAVEDAGLTLPDDYDAEGLTLPADYDDGLTLAPEAVVASADSAEEEGEDEEDEASDTEVLPVEQGEVSEEGRSEARRRRHPRRTREDAYWDMLENWEWEEIPDDDSPRGEGERPRSSRGDRGDRRGGRGDRGRRDRGRDERPRAETRSPTEEQRPPREERRPAETAPTSEGDSGERPRRPRRGDRPRDDRGPREDRPRGERRPERDDRRRDEPRRAASASPPAAAVSTGFDDFGSGIFEAEPPVTPPVANAPSEVAARGPREESIAQSSRAADAVLRSDRGSTGRPVEDELVWPDDDSDVRPAPAGSVVETSGLPPAESAGESDEMVAASDVEPLGEDDEALRPRRRRRRRRGERSEPRTAPPDGNEGTTFDLSDALATEGESPDFIPAAVAEDSAVGGEENPTSDSEALTDEDRSSEQRGGRRRRRRRRRPGEGPAGDAASRPDRETSDEGMTADVEDASDEESFVVKPITYSNIPSWEEAIKYLLQPHLVGRNLGPEDADESLENDPRGSGGAEPTPPPPPQRRRGGGGRGRRH